MVSERIGTNSIEMDGTINTNNHNYNKNINLSDNLESSESIKYNKLSEESIGQRKLNKKDYALIATYSYVNIMTGCVYSCLAPFFPKEVS